MFKFFNVVKNKSIFTPEESFDYYKYYSKTERVEIEKLFKRVFTSGDGKNALAYLQFLTCQRAQNFNSTIEQMYFYEGQRSLIVNIIRLISKN